MFKSGLLDSVALQHGIHRWLAQNPNWLANATSMSRRDVDFRLGEDPTLWIGPSPTHSNAPPPAELEQLMTIARKFDVAARDARNRALGRAGEQRVVAHECAVLTRAGRSDLARRVRWVSEEDGDGAGYDIKSFRPDGGDRLIEVKTTNGWERTPFHISSNELAASEARREDWRLVRLWNFVRDPRAFDISAPLEAYVALTPTSFQASFS